jgi:hypothetical protein
MFSLKSILAQYKYKPMLTSFNSWFGLSLNLGPKTKPTWTWNQLRIEFGGLHGHRPNK